MAAEIERKFLVTDDSWRDEATEGQEFCQGYLVGARQASVRVRLEGEKANLNVKGMTLGVARREFEYPIPLADARDMLEHLCERPFIEKRRYFVPKGEHIWEVDVFRGDNEGLIVAEVELAAEDEPFERPSWLGEEVSHDPRYYNVNLVRHPYREWAHEAGGR